YRAQRAIEDKSAIVVGLNQFVAAEERPIATMSIDPSIEADQVARLHALRARRDADVVKARLAASVDAAREGRSLVRVRIDAVSDLVTLGEIVESLKTVFGEHRDIESL